MGRAFGKPYAGVENDAFPANPRRCRDGNPVAQFTNDVGHDITVDRLVVHRARTSPRVHQHDGGTGVGRHAAEGRLELQPADVVDHDRAGRQRGPANGCFVGINRNRDVHTPRDLVDHRQHTLEFFLGRHRYGAGTGRFAADVDDVGAVGFHAQCRINSARRYGSGLEFRERIGGDVEDSHHQRAASQFEDPTAGEWNVELLPRDHS